MESQMDITKDDHNLPKNNEASKKKIIKIICIIALASKKKEKIKTKKTFLKHQNQITNLLQLKRLLFQKE